MSAKLEQAVRDLYKAIGKLPEEEKVAIQELLEVIRTELRGTMSGLLSGTVGNPDWIGVPPTKRGRARVKKKDSR